MATLADNQKCCTQSNVILHFYVLTENKIKSKPSEGLLHTPNITLFLVLVTSEGNLTKGPKLTLTCGPFLYRV
jgi:hypothetical protein